MTRFYISNSSLTFFFARSSSGDYIFTECIREELGFPRFKGNFYRGIEDIPEFLEFLTDQDWRDSEILMHSVPCNI